MAKLNYSTFYLPSVSWAAGFNSGLQLYVSINYLIYILLFMLKKIKGKHISSMSIWDYWLIHVDGITDNLIKCLVDRQTDWLICVVTVLLIVNHFLINNYCLTMAGFLPADCMYKWLINWFSGTLTYKKLLLTLTPLMCYSLCLIIISLQGPE